MMHILLDVAEPTAIFFQKSRIFLFSLRTLFIVFALVLFTRSLKAIYNKKALKNLPKNNPLESCCWRWVAVVILGIPFHWHTHGDLHNSKEKHIFLNTEATKVERVLLIWMCFLLSICDTELQQNFPNDISRYKSHTRWRIYVDIWYMTLLKIPTRQQHTNLSTRREHFTQTSMKKFCLQQTQYRERTAFLTNPKNFNSKIFTHAQQTPLEPAGDRWTFQSRSK